MLNLAKGYALILGIVLLVIGLLGFVPGMVTPYATHYTPMYSGAPTQAGLLFGIFAVDPIINIIHLLSGLIGIAAGLSTTTSARYYAITFGILYTLIAIAGFVEAGSVLTIFVSNFADNVLHLIIGVFSIAMFFTTVNTTVITNDGTVVRV